MKPYLREHGISESTVYNLFVPPNKRNKNAERYKSLIDARVQKKQNNHREDITDSHFLFARISMRDQMAVMFKDDISEYSCNDMNKLLVGVTAVNRYHQIRGFPLKDMSPNYSNHDFPYPGW